MKIIVDKLPNNFSICLFFMVREGNPICKLDEDSPISHCYKTGYCPYLITSDSYLDKRIKKYYKDCVTG